MLARRPGILVLGLSLFCTGASFAVYQAALPLYFAALGFDPTLIGLLIGVTAATQLASALVLGPAIDRFGARLILFGGSACYLLAACGYLVSSLAPALVLWRALQGLGLAAIMPASYSYVPSLVPNRGQVVAFSSLGAANNLAMAICPLLGLLLLDGPGPPSLFAAAAGAAVLGGSIAATVPAPRSSRRPFGLTFGRAWTAPIAINVAVLAQWGVVTTFMPLAAAEAGQNPALLFTTDALAVLAMRVPAAWLAERFGALPLVLAGLLATVASDLLLLLPLNDPLLALTGLATGGGGAMVLPPLLAQLSRRSDERTRGTALSYFSVSVAFGLTLGSAGGGLLYPYLGFHGLLVCGAGVGLAILGVALADPLLRVAGAEVAA